MQEYFNEKKWKENPNPNAKIIFVITYPFQFYVYKNIYRHLDNAEFLVDLGAFYPVRISDKMEANIINFLDNKNVYYRILYYSDYFFKEYLSLFFDKYSVLVGVWETGCNSLMCNQNKKKVNLTYGAGKELTQVRFSRRYNDLILAYGERDHKLFSLFTEAKIVGNPKFDDWFNDEIDYSFLREINENIIKDRKTLLYLPTHGNLSSLKELISELKLMLNFYNVIVKMHYVTTQEEPETIKELSDIGIIVVQDDFDLLPLLKVSDVVLSDNSSAIFDAILADKPLVVTDFISGVELDIKYKKLSDSSRGSVGPLTYSGSIEQLVKKDGSLITVKKPKDLSGAIKEALQDGEYYKQKRKKIRNEIFSFNDGKSGLRAAEEIKNILISKHRRKKPILFHAIENYIIHAGHLSLIEGKKMKLELDSYKYFLIKSKEENLKNNKIVFTVVVLDFEGKNLESTLRSLYNQELPIHNYEIVVVSLDDKETVISKFLEIESVNNKNKIDFFIKKINFIKQEKKDITGDCISKVLNISSGGIVCFTFGGYLLSADWLSKFLFAYERFPDIAGVGGYASYFFKTNSIFQNFFDLQLMEKLGLRNGRFINLEMYEVKNNVYYQNPAGSFCNISYKKEILMSMQNIFQDKTIKILELELKLLITANHQICFIPYKIFAVGVWTFKKFITENFFEGFNLSSVYYLYQKKPIHYKVTFLKCVSSFLVQLINSNNMRLATVFFIGYFSRWLGLLYYKFIMIKIFVSKMRELKHVTNSSK